MEPNTTIFGDIVGTFDIETVQTEIAKVKPERQGYRELIDGLHHLLTERIAKGATIRELETALSVKGIEVSERSLKTFLDTGRFSSRKPSQKRVLNLKPEDLPPFLSGPPA